MDNPLATDSVEAFLQGFTIQGVMTCSKRHQYEARVLIRFTANFMMKIRMIDPERCPECGAEVVARA